CACASSIHVHLAGSPVGPPVPGVEDEHVGAEPCGGVAHGVQLEDAAQAGLVVDDEPHGRHRLAGGERHAAVRRHGGVEHARQRRPLVHAQRVTHEQHRLPSPPPQQLHPIKPAEKNIRRVSV
ncbi:Os06g0531500, partial [Oryza sativa Japonica Group]